MTSTVLSELFEITRGCYDDLSALDKIAYTARLQWLKVALRHQIPPVDWDWTIWLLLAGRGAGKTRCAAEWVWWEAWKHPRTRWLVSAPITNDLRKVCFEGDSGLLSVIPHQLIDKYNKSTSELTLMNGSILAGISAEEPNRFRGPQFHGGWLDELAAWNNLDDSWDLLQFGLRLGEHPRLICTTTPKPKPLIIDLVKRNGVDVHYTSATTYDNINNLAPTFRKQIMQYEGTKLGRQEINAEIIDPEESGIIKRSWIKMWPVNKILPQFIYLIQSYDCATSEKTANDPTACTVWGVFKPSDDESHCAMLIDCWEDYVQYPDLRSKVAEEFTTVYGEPDEWGNGKKTDLILIEDKSSGIALQQDLQRAGLPVRPYNPGKADKAQRLNIVSPLFARGKVYIPESSQRAGQFTSWADSFITQLCSYTGEEDSVRHDDYIDSCTQALRLLRDSNYIKIDYFATKQKYADDFRRHRNPYAQ